MVTPSRNGRMEGKVISGSYNASIDVWLHLYIFIGRFVTSHIPRLEVVKSCLLETVSIPIGLAIGCTVFPETRFLSGNGNVLFEIGGQTEFTQRRITSFLVHIS